MPYSDVVPDFASGVFHAPSKSNPQITYTLGVSTWAGALRVSCTCPAGRHARPDIKPVPCSHAKAVAALLEGHGLVGRVGGRVGGRWVVTAGQAAA